MLRIIKSSGKNMGKVYIGRFDMLLNKINIMIKQKKFFFSDKKKKS